MARPETPPGRAPHSRAHIASINAEGRMQRTGFWGKATGLLARRLPFASVVAGGRMWGVRPLVISLPQINHVSGSVVQTFPVECKLINVLPVVLHSPSPSRPAPINS